MERFEANLSALIAAIDELSPARPRGLALRPGYPMYRPNGQSLGMTKTGDRITHLALGGGPEGVRLPMPVSHPQEWVSGAIADAQGPYVAVAYVPAAAVEAQAD